VLYYKRVIALTLYYVTHTELFVMTNKTAIVTFVRIIFLIIE